MQKIFELGDDVSYQGIDPRTGFTKIIDVCKKSDGQMVLRCYNKNMNSDGEFDTMGIYFDEIIQILNDKGYRVEKVR